MKITEIDGKKYISYDDIDERLQELKMKEAIEVVDAKASSPRRMLECSENIKQTKSQIRELENILNLDEYGVYKNLSRRYRMLIDANKLTFQDELPDLDDTEFEVWKQNSWNWDNAVRIGFAVERIENE